VRLLVTRPESDGEQTAAALRARGHDVLLAPLLRIEPVAADLDKGPWAGVLMTSANAARAIAAHPRHAEIVQIPVFTVGHGSAEAARGAGFAMVTSADGDASDLVRLVAGRLAGSKAPLLYLAGERRSADIAGALAEHGINVRTVVVYRAIAAADLPAAARSAIAGGDIHGVLHFSPRSAATFVEAARVVGILDKALNLLHYCLSRQVAAPLEAAGAAHIRIASRSDENALLDLVGVA